MTRYETRRVRLRPVDPDDYPALRALEDDPASLTTWRYRGALPSLADYERHLWAHGTAIQVVESRNTGGILGYCQLYEVDPRAEHGWWSIYAGPDHRGRGLLVEGCLVFFEWAFANWPLRWLYAHVLDANWGTFSSIVERGPAYLGRMEGRALVDGEPHDVHVIAIPRDVYLAERTHRLVAHAMAAAARERATEDRGGPPAPG